MGRTYSDAVTAGTLIKGSHVRDLRNYIQEDLDHASVSFTWGWDSWTEQQDATTRILAIHFTRMRDAIQALWHSKGRPDLPDWTEEAPRGPSSGASDASIIRASHITDLRLWLNQYESNWPDNPQGVSSVCYDPRDDYIIQNVPSNDWTGNITHLSGVPLNIRVNFISPIASDGSTRNFSSTEFQSALARYKTALNQYAAHHLDVTMILSAQFYWSTSQTPQDEIEKDINNPNHFTNAYIRAFIEQARQVKDWFHENGVEIKAYIV
jgi:hypothetical protein